MFTNKTTEVTPTVDVAINKSRIKQHNKQSEIPTYYLKDGSEFQLELFNPTTDVVLAKIEINNKLISQSGLIINPGQRVFLERYLDIDRKFKFETYEVNDTKEVQAAIANNGDLKVLFYREIVKPQPILTWGGDTRKFFTAQKVNGIGGQGIQNLDNVLRGTGSGDYQGPTFTTNSMTNVQGTVTTGLGDITYSDHTTLASATLDSFDMGSLSLGDEVKSAPEPKKSKTRSRKSKTIESGRVEQGSLSDQKFQTVDKDFSYSPFCVIEYKMLPVSQKPQTVKDVVAGSYCTFCGMKNKSSFRFCPKCGTKV